MLIQQHRYVTLCCWFSFLVSSSPEIDHVTGAEPMRIAAARLRSPEQKHYLSVTWLVFFFFWQFQRISRVERHTPAVGHWNTTEATAAWLTPARTLLVCGSGSCWWLWVAQWSRCAESGRCRNRSISPRTDTVWVRNSSPSLTERTRQLRPDAPSWMLLSKDTSPSYSLTLQKDQVGSCLKMNETNVLPYSKISVG